MFSLIETVYSTEHPAPAYLAVEKAIVLVDREPDKQSLSYNVVFWNESPITRVGTIVSVVTHHPIVVHLECITVSLLAVDVYFAFLVNIDCVSLIYGNGAFIYSKVVKCQFNSFAFLWNPNRTIVVGRPSVMFISTGSMLLHNLVFFLNHS